MKLPNLLGPGSPSLGKMLMMWLSLSVLIGVPFLFLETLFPELDSASGLPVDIDVAIALVVLPLGWFLGRWILSRFASDPAIETAPLLAETLGLESVGEVWVGPFQGAVLTLRASGELEFLYRLPHLSEGLRVRSKDQGGPQLQSTGNAVLDQVLAIQGAEPHDLQRLGQSPQALLEGVHGLGAELRARHLRATLWLPGDPEQLEQTREALTKLSALGASLSAG